MDPRVRAYFERMYGNQEPQKAKSWSDKMTGSHVLDDIVEPITIDQFEKIPEYVDKVATMIDIFKAENFQAIIIMGLRRDGNLNLFGWVPKKEVLLLDGVEKVDLFKHLLSKETNPEYHKNIKECGVLFIIPTKRFPISDLQSAAMCEAFKAKYSGPDFTKLCDHLMEYGWFVEAEDGMFQPPDEEQPSF